MTTQGKFLQVIILALVAALLMAACATTPIGKAVQSAEAQKRLVEGAMIEVAKLHLQGKMSESDYAKARKDYQAWADVQNALAASLSTWKAVSTAENGQKVSAALQRLGPLTDNLLNFVGRFVDLTAVKAKLGG